MNVFYDLLDIRLTRGSLKKEVHYYPHGLPMGNMGSAANGFLPNRYRYQSNKNNKDLNLKDFNFRQYDTQIGRFAASEPLAGLADMESPYSAMANNPVVFVDPFGLQAKGAAGGAVWHFMLPMVEISDTRPPRIIPNPGGGNPFVQFAPPPDGWGKGSGGQMRGGFGLNAGGGGSSSGNSSNAPENAPQVSNGGSPDGVEGGSYTGASRRYR